MKKDLTAMVSKSCFLFLFFFIGITTSYSQTVTYVSSTVAIDMLSQEMSDMKDKPSDQLTKKDDLMEEVAKDLMHRIEEGSTVGNAIESSFQEYLSRVSDINSTVEEITAVKTYTVEMLTTK